LLLEPLLSTNTTKAAASWMPIAVAVAVAVAIVLGLIFAFCLSQSLRN